MVFEIPATFTDLGDSAQKRIFGQFLDARDRQTPVGDPFSATATLSAESLTVAVQRTTAPGEANALIYGTPLELEMTATVDLCSDSLPLGSGFVDFLCGTGDGEVFAPIELHLAGSLFAAQRSNRGAAYPHPLVDCDRTPADRIE